MRLLLVFLLLAMGQASAEMQIGDQTVDTMPQYMDAIGIDPTDSVEWVMSPSNRLYFFKHKWEQFRLALPGNHLEYKMDLAGMRVKEMVMEAKHLNNTKHLGWLVSEYAKQVKGVDDGLSKLARIDEAQGLALNKQARLQVMSENMILHHLYRHTALEGKEPIEIAFNKTVEQYQIKLGRAILLQNKIEAKKKVSVEINGSLSGHSESGSKMNQIV